MGVYNEPEPETWTFDETCRALGINEHLLRRLMRRSDNPIPHARVGRRILFSPIAVRSWLKHERGENSA